MLKFRRPTSTCALLFAGLLACSGLQAQSSFATLTGVVSDSSGAVVPNANVTLRNASSGDLRKSVTNHDGFFTFSSFPTGEYTVTILSEGFEKSEITGLAFTGAERRNLDIILKVGSAATQVDVISEADVLAPVDSGEKSNTITTKQLQDFSVVGRSAAEFIKVLPGFAIIAPNGVENRPGYTGEVIGINGNGDGGSQSAFNGAFAAQGTPSGTMDITADGAHVTDPGCNCATPVNPNNDMIQELKVLTSNFSAENTKGPIVLNTVSKAGGRDYHGEAYFYARNYSMNANDWINNKVGLPRPQNKYYFPGGNVGGPVLIPGTGFNKHRDKLFFFTGYEYFYQVLDTGLLTDTVPTAGMRNGDFSPAELAKLGTKDASGGAPQQLNAQYDSKGVLNPNWAPNAGGVIAPSNFDPSGLNLLKQYPLPNADPNSNGGFNYVRQVTFDQPGFQWLTRVDYSISDNTKLFVRYNLQKETQHFPVGLWWRNGGQLPYYSPIDAPNQSQSISASLTHVFNPSLTNEFVFGYTYIDFQNVFHDKTKVDRTAQNVPFAGVYKNGVKQLPSLNGWGGEFASIFNPGGFESGGSKGLYADKWLPSFSDTISKVWGTHTAKFGGYYEWVRNAQPNNGYSNGLVVEANWGGNSSGNPYADLLLGRAAQYTEQNVNQIHDEVYNVYEFFAQDSWKVSRRLTLDYGVRASHLGQWSDRTGNGFAVWDPSTYSATAAGTDYTGLSWYKRNHNVPLSGFSTKALNFGPRFGLAYDIFGTGKTVLRGGWGRYIYHNAQFTQGLDAPAGIQTQTYNATTFAELAKTNPGTVAIGTGAVDRNDHTQPQTDSYSFTISQQIPGASLLEVSYVGNQSSHLLNTGGVGTNVNLVPVGSLLNIGKDPNSLSNFDAYRPFTKYQDLNVANHNLYGNYNSMQVSFVRQRGRYDYSMNYTWSKAFAIVGTDPFNLRNDYGPAGFDRRHLFNAAYSVELPDPVKSNRLLKGMVNGWQLSGITQIQSGANITPNNGNGSSNFSLNTNGFKLANGYNVTNATILGTSAIQLNPIVTCNPASNLGKNQFVNGNCFAIPTQVGQNGPNVLPELFGPLFWNSDLSMFKNFKISESKKLQFRFSTYNFLNHPLNSFRSSTSNLNLNFNGTTGKLDNSNFGFTTEKEGHRIVQLALKFYF